MTCRRTGRQPVAAAFVATTIASARTLPRAVDTTPSATSLRRCALVQCDPGGESRAAQRAHEPRGLNRRTLAEEHAAAEGRRRDRASQPGLVERDRLLGAPSPRPREPLRRSPHPGLRRRRDHQHPALAQPDVAGRSARTAGMMCSPARASATAPSSPSVAEAPCERSPSSRGGNRRSGRSGRCPHRSASSTTTRADGSRSRSASAVQSPVKPPPTMHTSAAASPSSGALGWSAVTGLVGPPRRQGRRDARQPGSLRRRAHTPIVSPQPGSGAACAPTDARACCLTRSSAAPIAAAPAANTAPTRNATW